MIPPTTHIQVKGQGHTEIMNINNMSQVLTHPMAWYVYVKAQRLAQTQIHGENIILILRPKVKVIQKLEKFGIKCKF